MKKRDFIIKKIVDVVDQTAPDSELYLYGSRARGTAKRYSDWDLLILLNTQQLPFDLETKFMDNLYEIEIETGEIISPLIYTKQDWVSNHSSTPLYTNVYREGVRLK